MNATEGSTRMDELLARSRQGDRAAYDRVFAESYRELTALARQARRRLSGATLNTTGLVHECYMRLLKANPEATNAAHFLAIAAQAMRHLLIERARARVTTKRGADAVHVDIEDTEQAEIKDAEQLLEVDDLLRKLAATEPQQEAVIECRFFGGLSDQETAAALGISVRTVQREWARAREWLAAQGT
jgi:RNA polymerase sigma factor (TIGR02999 family)